MLKQVMTNKLESGIIAVEKKPMVFKGKKSATISEIERNKLLYQIRLELAELTNKECEMLLKWVKTEFP